MASCVTTEKLQQRVKSQLNDFIEKSEYKSSLSTKIEEKEALYTIIHIRQQHHSSLYNKQILKELEDAQDLSKVTEIKKKYFGQITKINTIQKEIYDFLMASTSQKDFLYVEGRSYPHHYRDAFLSTYVPESIAEISKNLNTKGAFSHPIPDPPHFIGASITIHKERKMNVLGAENLALLNLTLSLYENKKFSENDVAALLKECHEAREDQMIKNMIINFEDLSYRMSSLRFLVCGSKHDFEDNVKKWNEKNPDKKVNLLVFTPPSLNLAF